MASLLNDLITNLKRERLLAVTNIIIMTITFLILGMFVDIISISQTALRHLENQAQITLFFKDDFDEKSILDLKSKLETDSKVANINYISKEEAFKIFTQVNKDQPTLLNSASANILPASLQIKAKKLSDLTSLAESFKSIDGVEEVKYYKDVIDKFRNFSNSIYIIGFMLVIVFLIVSYSVVIATLRTTINSKGEELEILKLVGASDAFVKKPLLFQGIFFGAASSFIAGIILISISVAINKSGIFNGNISFGFIPNFELNFILFSAILAVILILSGILLGYFGSSIAIKRYLKY